MKKEISIELLGKHLTIVCPKDEEENLREAAQYLEEKTKEQVKNKDDSYQPIISDKVLLVMMLNIVSEFNIEKRKTIERIESILDKIEKLNS